MKLLKQFQNTGIFIFFIAAIISFIGSLPPGTTNILTIQLSASEGKITAAFFALGCLIAEIFYVAISLYVMARLMRFKKLIRYLQWVSFALLLFLAIASFMATFNNSPAKVINFISGNSPFFFGFVLMIINPVQIPFWLGWNTILLEKKFLQLKWSHYIFYAIGAGAGSMLASIIFIFAGKWVLSIVSQHYFYYIIAIVFLITALLQLIAIVKKPSINTTIENDNDNECILNNEN